MTKHLATNVPNASSDGKWPPLDLCGFDLADVSSTTKLNGMPEGVLGSVYTGSRFIGNMGEFPAEIDRWRGNPKVWGYSLVDEPYPDKITPADLKAMSDHIRRVDPGKPIFVKFTNLGPPENPRWTPYNLENTGLDYFGVGGYAVRSRLPGGYDPELIKRYVDAAVRDGIPRERIFPCMQTFGGAPDGSVAIPTRQQMDEMFASWRESCPDPAFDMSYSWGIQQKWMTEALVNNEMFREALKAHFAAQAKGPAVKLKIALDGEAVAEVAFSKGSTLTLTSG